MEFGSKYLTAVSLDSSIFSFCSSVCFSIFLFLPYPFLSSSILPISKLSLLLHLSLPLSIFHTHKLQMNTHSTSGHMLGTENSEMRSRIFHQRVHSIRREGLSHGAAHCDRVLHRVMHRGVCQHREPPTQSGGSKIKE